MRQLVDLCANSEDAYDMIDSYIAEDWRVVSMAVGSDGMWIIVVERSES